MKVQVGALPGRQAKEAACDEAGREDGVRPGCTERAALPTSVFDPSGQRRPVSALSLSPKQDRVRVIMRKKGNFFFLLSSWTDSLVLHTYHMFPDERK